MLSKIDAFVARLEQQEHADNYFNPYRNKQLAENLRAYLYLLAEHVSNPVLLVGEAPGYKGCRITGIPFSSGKIFERFRHPMLQALQDKVEFAHMESENTATIVWEYLSKGRKTKQKRWQQTPLFWNSFPFHPHPVGNENKNRAPTSTEIAQGKEYLIELYCIFQPCIVAGVGDKGVACAKKSFPELDIAHIRHPSFGGKSDFIKGMNMLNRRINSI